MKFIRDLIEQKSSQVDAAAIDEDLLPAEPYVAAGDLEAETELEADTHSENEPFEASEIYRVLEPSPVDEAETAEDVADDEPLDALDALFGTEADDPDDVLADVAFDQPEDAWDDELAEQDSQEDAVAEIAASDAFVSEDAAVEEESEDDRSDDMALVAEELEDDDEDFLAESLQGLLGGAMDDPAETAEEDEPVEDVAAFEPEPETDFAHEPALQSFEDAEEDMPVTMPTARAFSDNPLRSADVAPVEPEETPVPFAQPAAVTREPGRVQPPAAEAAEAPAAPVEVPSPATGRGMGRAGRAKTRLLGFNAGMGMTGDPFAASGNRDSAGESYTEFPVGWLVVTDGPGRGAAFTLHNGVSQIGRGEGQTVRLDFGDNSISRENHAAIAFDAERNAFFIGHGGKANLVRCNNMPVLSTQALAPNDQIRIGETTLRFVPLCGPEFQWAEAQTDAASHAARG